MNSVMTSNAPVNPESKPNAEEVVRGLRHLFADAPALGRQALENVLQNLIEQAANPPPPVETAGRTGSRLGRDRLQLHGHGAGSIQ